MNLFTKLLACCLMEGPYPGGALLALLRRPSHWKRRLHKRLPAAIDPVAGLTLLQIKRNTCTSRCVIMRVTPNSITCHTCNQGTTMEHAQGWTLHTTDVRCSQLGAYRSGLGPLWRWHHHKLSSRLQSRRECEKRTCRMSNPIILYKRKGSVASPAIPAKTGTKLVKLPMASRATHRGLCHARCRCSAASSCLGSGSITRSAALAAMAAPASASGNIQVLHGNSH